MRVYTKLTREYENYLLRLNFGKEISLSGCIESAYRDFCRTLRGISKLKNKDELHANAVNHVANAFTELKTRLANATDQAVFDNWHRATCQILISVYEGHCTFSGGQAQKWVNMTLKYVYTVGEEQISGFQEAYQYCHAPLDNDVIAQLKKYGFPELTGYWSRIDYDEYFERQEWIRQRFAPVPPLEVEFWLWLGKDPIDCAVAAGQM